MYRAIFTIITLLIAVTLNAEYDNTFSVEQQSKKSIYESTLVCDKQVTTSSFQNCNLKLFHEGKLIKNEEIFINGDMPQHNHGLPTAPQIKWSEEQQSYMIEGLKFSMPGKWKLNFKVNAIKDTLKDVIEITIEVN